MKLTTKEVAEKMNISISLVRSLARQGKLPFCIVNDSNKVNNSYIFDRERFDEWKRGNL